MTFASDTVRFLYHQLPAERQVEFLALENKCAKHGQMLHIDGVMQFENVLEVLVRITFNYKADASDTR